MSDLRCDLHRETGVFPLKLPLMQELGTFWNLRVNSWVRSHTKGNQFSTLSENHKYSQVYSM